MNSLWIAQNILKRVFKSPKSIFALIILPVIVISIIVFALKDMEIEQPGIGVVNMDVGEMSNQLIQFIDKQNFQVELLSEDDYEQGVKTKKVSFGIRIPADFSQSIQAGRQTTVDLYYLQKNYSLSSFEQLINTFILQLYEKEKYVQTIALKTSTSEAELYDQLNAQIERQPMNVQTQLVQEIMATDEGAVANEQSDISDANQTSVSGPAIGFSIMFMMVLIFTVIGTILEDKKNLTLARMFVAPVREWEIIMGNLLGSLVLGLCQLVPLVIVIKFAYKINDFYTVLRLFVILLCFLIAVIGIGIGFSGLIKNSFTPTMLVATVITPSCILGGCFIPSFMMPDFLNKMGNLVPQKWVLSAIEKVFAGGSLGSVSLNLIIILMFGVVLATFGIKTIRPISE
ncbi:MAG: ABC transporter permease [Vallitaleaceae bacterium]|nr:ABC transporter permease [Vallitaleaceae bacterium]